MIYQKSKAKQIVSDQDKLTEVVSQTINTMAQIVGRTLGPGGRSVVIEREGLAPLITKDGVTVAKALGLDVAEANIIVDAAKEICVNTAKEAGDGTTTAIVLANALVKEGQKYLKGNKKCNPQQLIRSLNRAYNDVIVPYIESIAVETDTEEDLLAVATISANGDKEIADAAVEAVIAAGDDGTVLINEGQGGKTRVETVDGYIITSGLKELGQIGPAFINDKAGQQVKMDNGRVLLYDGSLNDLKVPTCIQNALADERGMSDGNPIIVLAHDFSDVVKDVFAKHTKGGQTILPVKTPRSGLPNGASIFLNDMAAYCGGIVYDPSNIEQLDEGDMGSFTEATVNTYESFIQAEGEPEAMEDRIQELKAIHDAAFGELDKHHLRAHIAKLTGGVSTIVVGGSSDLEIREKKGRVEDAVEAVRSAVAEGIVPGGGFSHLGIIEQLVEYGNSNDVIGWQILVNALHAPLKLLLTNAGEDYDSIVKELQSNSPNDIFDAENRKFVTLADNNVIEPAKVVRVSIGNAISVAALLMTLGGIVVVPRDTNLEQQMEMANLAFKNMMDGAE